jgi:hypothetical protein
VTLSELEVAVRELRRDSETWRRSAEVMRKAAQEVASVRDLYRGFGYLGEKANCDTTYVMVNETLKNVGDQAGGVFEEIGQKLDKAAAAYQHAEKLSADEVNKIKKGWHL